MSSSNSMSIVFLSFFCDSNSQPGLRSHDWTMRDANGISTYIQYILEEQLHGFLRTMSSLGTPIVETMTNDPTRCQVVIVGCDDKMLTYNNVQSHSSIFPLITNFIMILDIIIVHKRSEEFVTLAVIYDAKIIRLVLDTCFHTPLVMHTSIGQK